MKPTFCLALLYLCLSLLAISCSEETPNPVACVQAEVVGTDCETGWYILLLLKDKAASERQNHSTMGQGSFVTTDNLPDAYKTGGLRIGVALELNGEPGPRCGANMEMYPAVRITHICPGDDGNHLPAGPVASRTSRLIMKIVRYMA